MQHTFIICLIVGLASGKLHWIDTVWIPEIILVKRYQYIHHSLSFNFSSAQSNFKCPKPDGLFPDTSFCDRYYDCFDGIAEVRVCPDGLVFDPLSRKREPCDHYFNVDCEDRLQLRKFRKSIIS